VKNTEIEIVGSPADSVLARLTTSERNTLDAVVSELNEAQAFGNLKTAKEMGQIIVKRFFGGDTQDFRANHRQHPTYRALAEHPDLKPSYSSLWYAVAVYDHFQAIDEEIASALTLTHHRLLAHVRDPEERRNLAARAVTEHMTADQLDQAIQGAKPVEEPDAAKRGRPRIPDVVKNLAKARKALVSKSEDGSLHDLASLTADQRSDAITDAKLVVELAMSLAARLSEPVGQ
jgi:hypothetical protein